MIARRRVERSSSLLQSFQSRSGLRVLSERARTFKHVLHENQFVETKLGDHQWSEDSWMEFVKDVAWWLYNEEERRDADTIDAAAVGLIKYGILYQHQL